MIEAGHDGAGAGGVTQQQAAATADVEQTVAPLQAERVEDRMPGEVVHVVGAVYGAGARAGRTTRDAIGQPIGEPIVRQLRGPPGGEPVVAEAETGDRLLGDSFMVD